MFKKIAIIIIIAFANVGTGKNLYQNNGFFILILNCFCFWIQMTVEPFISDDLNNLDLKASFITIITIFLGLFSSVCENYTLQKILMVIVILVNVYFVALFAKMFITVKFYFAKESKLVNSFKALAEKIFTKGTSLILLSLSILKFFRFSKLKKNH